MTTQGPEPKGPALSSDRVSGILSEAELAINCLDDLRCGRFGASVNAANWVDAVQQPLRALVAEVQRLQAEQEQLREECEALRAHHRLCQCPVDGYDGTDCTFRLSAAEYKSRLAAVEQEKAQLQKDIDQFWQYVEHGWDIEPRAYFEKEARTNGFGSPLAQAAHHVWKRDPKVTALESRLAAVEQAIQQIEPYVQHKKDCKANDKATITRKPKGTAGKPFIVVYQPCTCGRDDQLKALRSASSQGEK